MHNIGIIGLGYVGLPLALAFSKKYFIKAFDKDSKRIETLKRNEDINNEVKKFELIKTSKKIFYTKNIYDLEKCNVYIVAVPTPIKKNKKPELKFLYNACIKISQIIKKNDIVIFESTVYPGLTEEYCAKIIEKKSGLKFNKDFFCGYSPERINPGDNIHSISNIIKITSGSTPKISNLIDKIYKDIIKAGTYKVNSIKIAEAAKVIENAQRDINIAFINEISIIFDKIGIDTNQILKAASTKWNFINFKPGLVGGHCIGVDPYYLTHKSLKLGYKPKIILAGRKVNDSMPKYIFSKLREKMKSKNLSFKSTKILVMGITFKENCNDTRNSKVFDLISYLNKYKFKTDVYDPLIHKKKSYNLIKFPKKNYYDVIIIAVAHNEFIRLGKKNIINFAKKKNIIFDLKNIFNDKNFLSI